MMIRFVAVPSKLCISGATIRPKFASFILFIVLYFLLVIVFLFVSSFIFLLIHLSYSSLLIYSYSSRTILPLLILLFLYLCIVDIHIKLTLNSIGKRYINKRQN